MTTIPSELKVKHAAMWASGDYPGMVETFLTPLGPRLVGALPIEMGTRVLDVAAGTGNASIPAAERGGPRPCSRRADSTWSTTSPMPPTTSIRRTSRPRSTGSAARS